MHVVIDLETMGTRPDAAIIQVGAVMFEARDRGRILNGTGFNMHVLLQDGAGTVDHSTVAWWLREASAKKMGKEMEERAEPLADVLEAFRAWPEAVELDWLAIEGVWSNPSDFDLPIVKSAYNRFGADVPWDRRATRCARTLFHLAGGRPQIDMTGFTVHDALDDAVMHAMEIQQAMAALNAG